MNETLRLYAEPVREADFNAIGAIYTAIGTSLDHPARIIYVQNLTLVLVYISLDGINDHLALGPGTNSVIDAMANHSVSGLAYFSEGQKFYVRAPGAIPAIGSVYLSVFYAVPA